LVLSAMISARPRHQRSIDAFLASNQLLPVCAIENRYRRRGSSRRPSKIIIGEERLR
jgi:hypothetical protein